MGYGQWLHGEAVAAGMVLAAETAVAMGMLEESKLCRIRALIAAFDLPVKAPASMDFNSFIKHMRRDKKVLAGQLRLVLPTDIGSSAVVTHDDDALLEQVIRRHG